MTLPEFLATEWKTGKWKEIVKIVHENRFLFGFERKNKRSRHYRVKFMLDFPINLDESTAAYEKARAQVLASETADASGGAVLRAGDPLPAAGTNHLVDGQ